MKPKEMIALLKKLPPNDDIAITNNMGCPAYDYEGQRFQAGFDQETKTITMEYEIGDGED